MSFIKFSKTEKKEAIFFAINQQTADRAKKLGYRILKIGQEPIFDLKSYSTSQLPFKTRSAIKQVYKKGIVIEELSIESLRSHNLVDSLHEVLNQWILSRKSDQFKILTEVSPLTAAGDKKFFVARRGNTVEAFLACSPIPARNGFFLHDLIRLPYALNGISEALIAAALETLKKKGYSMASLGVSPLAGLEEGPREPHFIFILPFLKLIFARTEFFYKFKTLYQFKKKFQASHFEPAYIAFPPRALRWRDFANISSMLSDSNLLKQLDHRIRQWRAGYNLPRPLNWAVNPDFVFLSPLFNLGFETIFLRFKFTLSMVFLNMFAFVYTSDSFGNVDRNALSSLGFSYRHMLEHGWFVLFTSNFMHFNYPHLIGNMVALVLFSGALESLCGATLAALVYLVGMEANVPNGLVLLPILKLIGPREFHDTVSFIDIGASLGVMASFGGLSYFLKSRIRLFMVTGSIAFFIAYSIVRNELFGIDHAFAVVIGLYLAHWYASRPNSQAAFEETKFKFFHLDAQPVNSPILLSRHKVKVNEK